MRINFQLAVICVLLLNILSCAEDCEPEDESKCVKQEKITDRTTQIKTVGHYFESAWGNGEAIKQNVKTYFECFWQRDQFIPINQHLILISYTQTKKSIERIHMGFFIFDTGCFNLNLPLPGGNEFGYFNFITEDTITNKNNIYNIDTTVKNNYLYISKYDTINRILKGEFSLSFVLDTTAIEYVNDPNPRQLRFFNGRFETK